MVNSVEFKTYYIRNNDVYKNRFVEFGRDNNIDVKNAIVDKQNAPGVAKYELELNPFQKSQVELWMARENHSYRVMDDCDIEQQFADCHLYKISYATKR